jgi:hypothetical protein
MAKKGNDGGEARCPIADLFDALCGKRAGAGEFVQHLRNARVELLLAVRGLIDRKIEKLRSKQGGGSKARKIEVKEAE